MTDLNDNLRIAQRKLEELLLGSQLNSFTPGDWWSLRVDPMSNGNDLHVVFQELSSPKLVPIEEALRSAVPELYAAVDAEQIAWATLLASFLRFKIIGVSLDQKANMQLVFEDGTPITLRTDVEIVDWQWSVQDEPRDPYAVPIHVACLWEGEVEFSR